VSKAWADLRKPATRRLRSSARGQHDVARLDVVQGDGGEVGAGAGGPDAGRDDGLPVTALQPEEAQRHFGLFALFASMDAPACAALTRTRFGWEPVHPGLLPDLDEGHYFKTQ
jgi:hypothetical protein